MVGLRKLKGWYYARVYLKDCNGKWKDKLIALNTDQIIQAKVRQTEVKQFEELIKAGGDFIPSWKSRNGNPEVRQYSLDEAVKDYLKARKGDGLRSGPCHHNGSGGCVCSCACSGIIAIHTKCVSTIDKCSTSC